MLVVLLGIVIHLIESNLVIPLITAKKVELPPVLTIMSVLVVGSLLGPMGLLIAVPTLAVAMVVLRRILINRIYEGQGFRRASRDRALVLRVPAPGGGRPRHRRARAGRHRVPGPRCITPLHVALAR